MYLDSTRGSKPICEYNFLEEFEPNTKIEGEGYLNTKEEIQPEFNKEFKYFTINEELGADAKDHFFDTAIAYLRTQIRIKFKKK